MHERGQRARSPGGRARGVREERLAGGLWLLRGADAAGDLTAHDLEALAKSAWWIGHADESIAYRERAYATYLDDGDRVRAALMALTLRRENHAKLADSVAKGWLQRADHLLEGEPESLAHGYLALANGELALWRGELDHALEHFDIAVEIASRLDDPDLPVWAAMRRGETLATGGNLEEAFGLMEEPPPRRSGGARPVHDGSGVLWRDVGLPGGGRLPTRDRMGGGLETLV